MLMLQSKIKHIDNNSYTIAFRKKIILNYVTHVQFNQRNYDNNNNGVIIPNSVKFMHLCVQHKYTYCCIPNSVKYISYDNLYNSATKNDLLSVKWIWIKIACHIHIKKNTNVIFKINTAYKNTYNKQNYFLISNQQKISINVIDSKHFKQICYATKNINNVYLFANLSMLQQKINNTMSSYTNIYRNIYYLAIKGIYVIYNYYYKNVYNLELSNYTSFIAKKHNVYATNYCVYNKCLLFVDKCRYNISITNKIIYFSKFICKFCLDGYHDLTHMNVLYNIHNLNIRGDFANCKKTKIFVKNVDIFKFSGYNIDFSVNKNFNNKLIYVSKNIKIVILNNIDISKPINTYNTYKHTHTLLLNDCDVFDKHVNMFKNIKQLQIKYDIILCKINLNNKQNVIYIHTLQLYHTLFQNKKYDAKTNVIYKQIY